MQHKKLMGIVALLMCLTLVAPTVTIEAATTTRLVRRMGTIMNCGKIMGPQA